MVEQIKKISGVTDCQLSGSRLTVVSGKNTRNLSSIIECIFNNQSEIISLNMEKPTLENVFLTLTGRSLRD
jgi:ABC-2 type transport system ATP-binding protein